MKAIDIRHDFTGVGNLFTFIPIADTHMLVDTDSEEAYQPLDPEAWIYLNKCVKEVKSNPRYYGKLYGATLADLTEIERTSVRKQHKCLKKNDRKAQDSLYIHILRERIIPKFIRLFKGIKFIGGVAGNHLIEFFDHKDGINSDEYIVRKLGGTYLGESKGLINFHIRGGASDKTSVLIRAVILHGTKGGSKATIIRELQKLAYLYGKIDLVVMAHAHDPMTHFHCKLDLPEKENGRMKKHECLVVCLGSTRDGEKMGYDDYVERCNYPPSAGRFPMIICHAYKPSHANNNIEIKLRPIIM